MSEKTELEKHAVLEFCKAYKEQYGGIITYVGQCAPPLPDTRCNLDGKIIFIEVAHLYGKTSDAKKLLGRKGRSSPRPEEEKQARFTPLHIRIGNELAGILQQKFEKTYADDSVWLVVRNANPLCAPPLISWTDKTHHTQAAGLSARRCRARTGGSNPRRSINQCWL